MKYVHGMSIRVLQALLILLSGFLLPGKMEAQTIDGLYTEPYPEEQVPAVVERMSVSSSNQEPARDGIRCISVDAAERIAVGTSSGEQNHICVYNSKMDFLFSISFKASGSFSIVLSEDTVWAILWRSNLCVGIAPDGSVKEVLDIPRSRENIEYLNQAARGDPLIVNGNIYALQNQKAVLNLTGEYSKVVVTYPDGRQEVLYDVENQMMVRLIVKVIGSCLLFALTVFCVSYWQKEKRQGETSKGK